MRGRWWKTVIQIFFHESGQSSFLLVHKTQWYAGQCCREKLTMKSGAKIREPFIATSGAASPSQNTVSLGVTLSVVARAFCHWFTVTNGVGFCEGIVGIHVDLIWNLTRSKAGSSGCGLTRIWQANCCGSLPWMLSGYGRTFLSSLDVQIKLTACQSIAPPYSRLSNSQLSVAHPSQ